MIRHLESQRLYLASVLILGLVWLAYQSGLFRVWLGTEEYSHGTMVLLVLGYLVYRRRKSLPLKPSRNPGLIGMAAVLPVLVFLVGALAGINQLEMYAVWLFGVATVFAFGGLALVRSLLLPLLIAFMLIPLPNAIEPMVTAQLQLVSSRLGVWFIRLFGGVVFLQGNVIDMGSIQLLVAEACAGLRYLYPLMSLGAIAAYLLQASAWIRWTVFLATIPITIFMNSFRIGVTGIMVERWGMDHTEGFLHFFEGWVIFVFTLALLVLLAWVLLKLQPGKRGLLDSISFDAPDAPDAATAPAVQSIDTRQYLKPAGAVFSMMLVVSLIAPVLSARTEIYPERRPLAEFPVQLEDWRSREYRLPTLVEAVAGATEYHYADFSSPAAGAVNLYLSYYETQRGGKIPHSPKVCIPGDGWEIVSTDVVKVSSASGEVFEVNRLLTSKGNQQVLAYYWLKQGERMYRNELLARLDLIRLSAFERRTDGALVRLVADVLPGEDIAEADRRLERFVTALTGVLSSYVPD